MSKQQTKTAGEEAAQENELADFSWDDGDGTGDFFGIEGTAPTIKEEEEEKKEASEEDKEEDKEDNKPKADTKEEEEEDDFGDFEGGRKAEGGEEEEEDIKTSEYNTLALKMKESGIFNNIEISEEEELTEEKFIDLQDKEIESRVDEAFEGFFSELDDDAAAFLKFKKDGGNTEEFFKIYKDSGKAPEGDLDDENYQEKVSRYYYEHIEGDDSEDIDSKIEWLKDSGKLEKFAQKFDGKIKDSEKEAKENLQIQAKQADKDAAESKKRFVSSVQEALENTEKVDNFVFTPEGKKSLLPFITKQTVKVGKNRYITPMQDRLQTALKNPEKMLVLAQLLENDFDISSVVDSVTTGKTKKLKDDIQRKRTVNPRSSGKVGKKRSLADIDF